MVKVKEDLTGRKFGRLTVIRQVEDAVRPCGRRIPQWLCECCCDAHSLVIVEGPELKRHSRNGTKSCGCLAKEESGMRRKKYNSYNLDGDFGIGLTSNTNNQFYFDLNDYDLIKDYCWFEDDNGYIKAKHGKGHIKMHQLICGVWCDHINRRRYDNRRENLRTATQSENGKNRSLQKNNTSGITGVGWMKQMSKWRSRITVENQQIMLGCFDNKEDAIKARLNAEVKYFGEFAPQKHLYEQYGIIDN